MPSVEGVKISQLPQATTADGSDVLAGVQYGTTKRFPLSVLIAWIKSHIGLTAADVGAQDTITASGILKGDGAGGVSAATAGTDYQTPLTIDATPMANSTNPVQSGGVYTDVRTRVPNYGKGKNLLRNWYFVGGGTGRGVFPVNQRGQSSYTIGNSKLYSIDGWYIFRGIITPQADGVSLAWGGSSSGATGVIFRQPLKGIPFLGKEITFSALTESGLLTVSTVMANNTNVYSPTVDNWFINIGVDSGNAILSVWRSSQTAKKLYAVKLELGTEQTLAHKENGIWVPNEIPDYEYELYRCITSTADPTDTYANKSLATEQQIAVPQIGPKANRYYAANSYFCWNGLLFRATSAISNGADLTINANCVQTTVMDEIIRLT